MLTPDQIQQNRQNAFNTVWQAFVVDKKPFGWCASDAETAGGKCVYRGPNGERCAAGQVLPDAIYSVKMEGYRASQLGAYVDDPEPYNEWVRQFGIGGGQFLDELQQAHDSSVLDWDAPTNTRRTDEEAYKVIPDKLRTFAKQFGMTVPS